MIKYFPVLHLEAKVFFQKKIIEDSQNEDLNSEHSFWGLDLVYLSRIFEAQQFRQPISPT